MHDTFDFEKDPDQNPEEESKAPLTCKVGSAKINTSRLLDSIAHREQEGRPRFTLSIEVKVNRSGTAVAQFCRQEPLYIGEPGLDHGEVPLQEVACVEVEVLLNAKKTVSSSPRPEE